MRKRLNDNQKWNELGAKTKFAYITATICFVLGWALTITNFFVDPVGEISDGTLWVLGQSLTFCGAVIGICSYAKQEITNQVAQRFNEMADEEDR